jgi:ABC-type uncharacterized transport system substrate-binding protein
MTIFGRIGEWNRGVRAALLGLCGALALMAPAQDAFAHPHVFIEVQPAFIVAKGRIVGVRVDWVFDEIFSSALARDFDTDRDKQFSPAETGKLKAGAFDNLKDYGYFTHFRLNKKVELPAEVQDFSAAIEKNKVVYRFTVRPPQRVDPAKVSFDVMFYDETYFVDLRLAEGKPIAVSGAPGCSAEVDKNPDLPDYGGMFIPELVHVRCP